ncbi:unnamed protein product [Taenia asiatica]|uniref:Integrase catalytic domain-containing protein n=1 Tax=Taenia asiatica TaxID=60517 RepID=A0A0R3WGM2_TAEAS|nr:unnamed protein product [Taenia asiatica]
MDHQALTWLRTMKEIERSVARWYEELQQYDFTAQYRKGTIHSNAGALSRRPLSAERESGIERFVASSHKPTAKEMNSSSKAAKQIWRQWPKLTLEDEVLWYQDEATSPRCLVVSGSLTQTVLQELHEQLRHVGEEKMVDASSKRCWWPSLTPDVLDFCRTCITCSSFKKPHSTAMAPLQPMPTGFPGERLGIDIMGTLPLTKRGNRYILVMVDYFTKAAEAEAMKSQDAETVALTFFNCWICQHGVSESVHGDQGPNFESQLFIELCKTFGIAETRTTPGHPQGNRQAFTKGAKPEDWDLSLGRALLAYRATVHASMGVSPFKRLTGCKMRVPSDVFLSSKETTTNNVPDYVLRLKEWLRKTFNMARRHVQTSYSRQKKYYDKHSRPNTYHKGDLVQICNLIPTPGTHRKFCIPWGRDSFRVVKVLSPTNYLVRNAELRSQPITAHRNKMQPYKGSSPVGYEDEVCGIVEERKPPGGITKAIEQE